MYLLRSRPSSGYRRGTRPPLCRMFTVYPAIPSCSCSAPPGTPARKAHGKALAEGQVVFQGSSGWELGRAGVPASLVLPACQPQLLPGGFKTVLSSCFKFPGRGLQGGGAAGRLGCGLLFTRALCGMQLSRLEAPTIASSWAVRQPEELGVGKGGSRREERRGTRDPFQPSVLSASLGGSSCWDIRPGWASVDINVSINRNPSGLDAPELYGLYALNLSFPLPCFISPFTSPLSRGGIALLPSPAEAPWPLCQEVPVCTAVPTPLVPGWAPAMRLPYCSA